MSDPAVSRGSGDSGAGPGRRVLGGLAALMALYAGGGVLGFAIFAVGFKVNLLASLTVMFFRGVVLAGVTFAATFALLVSGLAARPVPGLRRRDAFSAAVLSLSVNLCFLVLVPVTVDRSISVFILGEMAADPQRLYRSEEVGALFKTRYVDEYQQIDRRLREQMTTGNVEKVGDRYRISTRGRLFIDSAKAVVWIFGGDRRLVTAGSATPPRDEAR